MPIEKIRFPGEDEGYRAAREELLKAELALRDQVEEVAKLRRGLPLGGLVPEDYEFEEAGGGSIRLSELFEGGKDTLVVYSYMYSAEMRRPCPMCTSILDGFEGQARHITQRVNLAVVAKSPATRLAAWKKEHGWSDLRLLSSAGNTYNCDYLAEADGGSQLPVCNVFVRRGGAVHHAYATEVLFAVREGQPRHMDQMWPLWNVLDLTPDGRGADWMPSLEYGEKR